MEKYRLLLDSEDMALKERLDALARAGFLREEDGAVKAARDQTAAAAGSRSPAQGLLSRASRQSDQANQAAVPSIAQ